MFGLFVLVSVVLWTLYSWICLYKNIQAARELGLPYRVIPVSSMNIVWTLSEPLAFAILDRLPFKVGNLNRYGRRAWHREDKAYSHLEMGDGFALVSPGEIMVYTCDPHAISDIVYRRNDFMCPVEMYKMLALFGPNVTTVHNKEWQRHRKIVATPFNENTVRHVWVETVSQARDMLSAWVRCGSKGALGASSDTRTLSLDVLVAAGFKKPAKFYSSIETDTQAKASHGYRDAMALLMDNAILMLVTPQWLLSLPVVPKIWNQIARAKDEYSNFLMQMLKEETQLFDQGSPGSSIFMSSLVRASELGKQGKPGTNSQALSVDEILGNIFMINLAGFETTANVLCFAIVYLAAHPEVQEWIGEELEAVLGDSRDDDWVYEDVFPRLKRCQSIMLECLRLNSPTLALPKISNDKPQPLIIGGRTYTLPPRTYITSSFLASHVHPRFWGDDALDWKPSRWIVATIQGAHPITKQIEHEGLYEPLKFVFFPWSEGPQNCIGKKFSQVEFVAVMARLFRNHRVRPALLKGESPEQARKRALETAQDCIHIIVTRMRDGDGIRLVWDEI